jgi:hypothetical protein
MVLDMQGKVTALGGDLVLERRESVVWACEK